MKNFDSCGLSCARETAFVKTKKKKKMERGREKEGRRKEEGEEKDTRTALYPIRSTLRGSRFHEFSKNRKDSFRSADAVLFSRGVSTNV